MTPSERRFPKTINGSRKETHRSVGRAADPGRESPPEAASADGKDDEESLQGRHEEVHAGHAGGRHAARIPLIFRQFAGSKTAASAYNRRPLL